MDHKRKSESGQAMVLIVLAMVALLGMAALAIDGGMAYSDRRHAQNAADASALSGGLQKANNKNNTTIDQAIYATAGANGFQNGQVTPTISGPFDDLFGRYYLISVTIQSPVDTALVHFVYGGSVENTVNGVARVYVSKPALPGNAIIAMGDCTSGDPNQLGITGGGNSGGIETWQGGMFSNAPESSGGCCAIDPPTSAHPTGIVAHDGYEITSVGACDYGDAENMSPIPINAGANFGDPIDDPLADLPEPQCTANGSVEEEDGVNVYQPGRYGGSGQPSIGGGSYEPGIYCISGDVHLSGDDVIDGVGVVLYMTNGSMLFTGNAGMSITAPNESNCLGSEGEPTASCTYKGIAVFLARSNTSTFEVRGNGGDAIHGLVYALNGIVQARGGGYDPDETSVTGQIIASSVLGNGNGSFKVVYNENDTYIKPPSISMDK